MNLEEAIRSRRTHKAYGPDPVDPDIVYLAAGMGALLALHKRG